MLLESQDSQSIFVNVWLKLVVVYCTFHDHDANHDLDIKVGIKGKTVRTSRIFYIEFRKASSAFPPQVYWLMVILSWVAETWVFLECWVFPNIIMCTKNVFLSKKKIVL